LTEQFVKFTNLYKLFHLRFFEKARKKYNKKSAKKCAKNITKKSAKNMTKKNKDSNKDKIIVEENF
jgi:hypothetical protein